MERTVGLVGPGRRFTSRGEETYSNKVLSAMRGGCGGHIEMGRSDS